MDKTNKTKKTGKKRIKRSVIKFLIMEILNRLGKAALEVIDEGFLNPKYSFTHPTRKLLNLPVYDAPENKTRRRKLLSLMLYRLKKDGLVVQMKTKKKAFWRTTKDGKNFEDAFRINSAIYDLPPKDGKTRIVSFDIPEKERWKRDKLRSVLVFCDYSLLHQSLWMGTRPLPQEIFKTIKKLSLVDYVHIFEVSKKGTIKELRI